MLRSKLSHFKTIETLFFYFQWNMVWISDFDPKVMGNLIITENWSGGTNLMLLLSDVFMVHVWDLRCVLVCHHLFTFFRELIHLTHWGWDKMAAISQTTFWNAFSLMKILVFRIKFDWSLFLRVQLTIIQYWCRTGVKLLSEPMMARLVTHICVT